jgi:hypothetical protein
MASEAQRRKEGLAAVRVAAQRLRTLRTAVDKAWREAQRLRARKTLIQADDTQKFVSLMDVGVKQAYNGALQAGADFVSTVSI